MTENFKIKLILLFLSLIVSLHSAVAENIRGQVIDSLSVDGVPVSFGIYDLVTISDKRLSEFQTGLELNINIPPGLRSYRNSFALLIYKHVKPFPNTQIANYTVRRHYMRLLPARENTYIHIPYTVDYNVAIEPFTDVVPIQIENEDLPLILVISPVVKGIPDDAFEHKLQISAKQILSDQGVIEFNFPNISPAGENEKIQVSLDGTVLDTKSRHIVKSGTYHLRATSNHAHPIERSLEILRGEDVVVDLPFDYGPPVITVVVPEGFRAFVDGVEIPAGAGLHTREIEPGKHQVQYLSGELSYEREFAVIGADKLRIDLNVDINLSNSGQLRSDFILEENP